MARKFAFSVGEYYHIYNRGVDKRNIFSTEHDKRRFQMLLYLANGAKAVDLFEISPDSYASIDRGEELCAIGAYCLMDNHFHILAKEIREGGISRFMQKLGTAYTMYFNIKEDRSGALFEGHFRAKHVVMDSHLWYLRHYIHLNPVSLIVPGWDKGVVDDLGEVKDFLKLYPFSSFGDYCDSDRADNVILNTNEFPKYEISLDELEKSTFEQLKLEVE